MDIQRFTEIAESILKADGTEQRNKGINNLLQRIKEDTGGIITDCFGMIGENVSLRFGDFRRIFNLYENYQRVNDSLNLLIHYANEILEYERDSEEKRAERERKLKEYANTDYIELPPKRQNNVKLGRTKIIRNESPDLIYCKHGTYRLYREVRDTFYFRLGRRILDCDSNVAHLKEMFQKVCLYIALKNESALIEETLSLLGMQPVAVSVAPAATTAQDGGAVGLPQSKAGKKKEPKEWELFIALLDRMRRNKEIKEKALLLKKDSQYYWGGNNALLSYLAGRHFCGDKPCHDVLTHGNGKFPTTKLNGFFLSKDGKPICNLAQSRSNLGVPPNGHEIIDKFFGKQSGF